MASRLPSDAQGILGELFGNVLFDVMTGMTKAEKVEEKYGKLGARLKELTEERMRRVATVAGHYIAQHASPSPKRLSPEQVATLKTRAIAFALEQLDNDAEADG